MALYCFTKFILQILRENIIQVMACVGLTGVVAFYGIFQFIVVKNVDFVIKVVQVSLIPQFTLLSSSLTSHSLVWSSHSSYCALFSAGRFTLSLDGGSTVKLELIRI